MNTILNFYLALLLFCVPLGVFAEARGQMPTRLLTPIESVQHTRISKSTEMHNYMQTLAALDSQARIELLGESLQGKPLEAIVFRSPIQPTTGRRLTVMIIGSLHGAAEAAGGEALLQLARTIARGDLALLRNEIDFVLIPNANPDGRDLKRRSNANRVNINTDFAAITQPETVALKQAVIHYRPDIVLDSHESAIYKRETLARQNYMTDVWAQFESTNNPAMPTQAREFSYTVLLPDMIARTRELGLPAQRYIGEITSIYQPITNGSFTLRNFRNMAGLSGALSFLVETRLDARIDKFRTYHNIAERIERQVIVLTAFIHSAHAYREAIVFQVDHLRTMLAKEPVMLKAQFVLDESHPQLRLPMTRLDSRTAEMRTFIDHRKLLTSDRVAMPGHLLITRHIDEMEGWLTRQNVEFERVAAGRSFQIETNRYQWHTDPLEGAIVTRSGVIELTLNSVALLIDLQQSQGRSAWVLLDPRSVSSVFRHEPYKSWLKSDEYFWISPVMRPAFSKLSMVQRPPLAQSAPSL